MKEIDLDKSMYELTEKYPELIDVMKDMGFYGVVKSIVRKTLGRVTSLRQGCVKQGKDVAEVIQRLEQEGFKVKS